MTGSQYQEIGKDYLEHYGVLGMKWGVRRYQNADGTLTAAGKKRYNSMSGEKLYKTLQKEIRNKRQEQVGWSNKFRVHKAIGENSKKLLDDHDRRREAYESTDAFKKWVKKVDRLNARTDIDPDEWNHQWEALLSEKPKKDFYDVRELVIEYRNNGRKYLNDYINKAGKEMSMAYLKDLGYDDDLAKEFIKKISKANRTLGDV